MLGFGDGCEFQRGAKGWVRIGWAGSAFLKASGPDGRWMPQLQLSPSRLKKAVTREDTREDTRFRFGTLLEDTRFEFGPPVSFRK